MFEGSASQVKIGVQDKEDVHIDELIRVPELSSRLQAAGQDGIFALRMYCKINICIV